MPHAFKASLVAMILAALALPQLGHAEGPFDDARDNILAGQYGNAMLIIGIGAIGVNDQDAKGYTLLHYAAKADSPAAVHELLNRGADPTIAAKDGETPLALATSAPVKTELAAAIARHPADGAGPRR